jgi:hypothetical protein
MGGRLRGRTEKISQLEGVPVSSGGECCASAGAPEKQTLMNLEDFEIL